MKIDFESTTLVADQPFEAAPGLELPAGRWSGFVYREAAGDTYKISDDQARWADIDVTQLVKSGQLRVLGA